MENQLRIISDTGEESNFQLTPIYNDQFTKISEVIQEHYDYFVNKIDNEFFDLYTQLKKNSEEIYNKINDYNLKIVDMFYDRDKKFEEKSNEFISYINDQIDLVNLLVDSRFDCVKNEVKDLNFNVDHLRAGITCSLEKLGDIVNEHVIEIRALKSRQYLLEEQNLIKEEEINKLIKEVHNLKSVIESLQDIITIIKTTQETVVSKINKPWYKRLFNK
jgi:hypothetical protein